MHDSISIACPHCGETFAFAYEAAEGSAQFTIDCEVCCRPMEITVTVGDDGDIASVGIESE